MTPALCQTAILISGVQPGENLAQTFARIWLGTFTAALYKDEVMGTTCTPIPRRPRDGTDTPRMPLAGPCGWGPLASNVPGNLINPHPTKLEVPGC